MSTPLEIPDWLVAQSAPPPPSPPVDDHRIEGLVNGFIAGKQDALFDAPDAYYRQQGADALDGAPAITERLQALRSATRVGKAHGGHHRRARRSHVPMLSQADKVLDAMRAAAKAVASSSHQQAAAAAG